MNQEPDRAIDGYLVVLAQGGSRDAMDRLARRIRVPVPDCQSVGECVSDIRIHVDSLGVQLTVTTYRPISLIERSIIEL